MDALGFNAWWVAEGQDLAVRFCNRWPGLRDDLIADVYVIAKLRFSRFDANKGTPDQWLWPCCRTAYYRSGHHYASKRDPRKHETDMPTCEPVSDARTADEVVNALVADVPCRALTKRMLSVLLVMARGWTADDTALLLGIQKKTVYFHLQRAYEALKIAPPARLQLALQEIVRLGIVTPAELFANDGI